MCVIWLLSTPRNTPKTMRGQFSSSPLETRQLNSRSSQTFLLTGAKHGTAEPKGKATAVEITWQMWWGDDCDRDNDTSVWSWAERWSGVRYREPSHPVNAAGRKLRRWKSYVRLNASQRRRDPKKSFILIRKRTLSPGVDDKYGQREKQQQTTTNT